LGNNKMKLLHIGSGNLVHKGFINSDKDEMDITKIWPYANETVDWIISMMVLQCLTWPELIFSLREAYRVLKKGGVMRCGLILVETGIPLGNFLYGKNITLFSFDLLKNILVDRIGFKKIKLCKWRETSVSEFIPVDNRHHRGASYIEVTK